MYSVARFVFAVTVLTLCFLPSASASAPARVQKQTGKQFKTNENEVDSDALWDQRCMEDCDCSRPEDKVLCEAHRRKEDTIRQVIADDNLSDDSETTESMKNADDIWVKAFNDWIGSKSKGAKIDHKKSKSAQRAIDIAQRRHDEFGTSKHAENKHKYASDEVSTVTSTVNDSIQLEHTLQMTNTIARQVNEYRGLEREGGQIFLEETENSDGVSSQKNNDIGDNAGTDEDDDDDELKLVTKAAKTLLLKTATETQVSDALALTLDLCASGDNGRQFASAGGISAISTRLTELKSSFENSGPISMLLRTLSSCCQNNAVVFNMAIDIGIIHETMEVVATMRGRNDGDAKKIRAAALGVFLAVSDGEKGNDAFWEERETITRILAEACDVVSDSESISLETSVRRGIIRAFALVESLLCKHGHNWRGELIKAGLDKVARDALNIDDIDVREGAARIVQELR